jgi:MFS family permease
MNGRWAVLALVALGTFTTTLDASIVIAATLSTFGRLSDLVGRKPVWMAGLAIFTLGSIFCGAAGSPSIALAGAVFAGLGGAAAGQALTVAPGGAVTSAEIVAWQDTFLTGFRGALTISAAIAAIGVFAALVRGDERRRGPGAAEPHGSYEQFPSPV